MSTWLSTTANANWGTSSNWSAGLIPSSSRNVTINNSTPSISLGETDRNAKSITFGSNISTSGVTINRSTTNSSSSSNTLTIVESITNSSSKVVKIGDTEQKVKIYFENNTSNIPPTYSITSSNNGEIIFSEQITCSSSSGKITLDVNANVVMNKGIIYVDNNNIPGILNLNKVLSLYGDVNGVQTIYLSSNAQLNIASNVVFYSSRITGDGIFNLLDMTSDLNLIIYPGDDSTIGTLTYGLEYGTNNTLNLNTLSEIGFKISSDSEYDQLNLRNYIVFGGTLKFNFLNEITLGTPLTFFSDSQTYASGNFRAITIEQGGYYDNLTFQQTSNPLIWETNVSSEKYLTYNVQTGTLLLQEANLIPYILIPYISTSIQDKIYDRSEQLTQSLILDLSGINLSYQNVSATFTSATYNDKNAETGKTITIYDIGLTGSDASYYQLSTPTITTSGNIIKKDISANFVVEEKIYDSTVYATLSGIPILNGIIDGDLVSLTISSAEFSAPDVGQYIPIVATRYDLSGTDAGNYHIQTPTSTGTITERDVSGTFYVFDKVYDTTTECQVSGTPIVNGGINDDVFLIISDAHFDNENVGVDKLVTATVYDLSGGSANNYRIQNAPTTLATIDTRDISGSFQVANRTFNGLTGATITSLSLTGILGSDQVGLTGSAYFLTPDIQRNKEVNLYNASLTGAKSGNYNLVSVSPAYATIYEIQGSLLLESLSSSYTYGDVVQLRTTINSQIDQTGIVSFYQMIESIETPIIGGSSVPVSSYNASLDVSGLVSGTYEFKSKYSLTNGMVYSSDIISVQVNKRNISVNCQVLDKNYDGTTTAALLSNQGIVNGLLNDNLYIQIISVSFQNSSAGVNKPIDSSYNLTGTNLDSYQLNLPITTATIRQLDISGSFFPFPKMYDATTITQYRSVVLTGILPGDVGSVSFSSGVANFEDPNVSTKDKLNKKVVLTGSLTGNKSQNYNFIGAYGSASISLAPLICNVKISNKPYDGTTIASISSVSSKVRSPNGNLIDVPQSDVSNIGYQFLANFNNDDVGTQKPVSVTGKVSNSNYYVVSRDASGADIYKRDIQGIVRSTREYNGSENVISSTKELVGVVSKDLNDVGFDVSGVRHSTQNVGVNSLIIGSYNITGSRAFNYNLSVFGIGTIIGRPLVARFPYSTKVYDGTKSMTLLSSPTIDRGTAYGQVYAKDASYVSITYDMIEFSDISAEVNKLMIVTNPRLIGGPLGNRSNNYSLASYDPRGTIYQKDISGTFYAANKIYDGSKSGSVDPTTSQLFGVYSFDVSDVGILVKSVQFENPDAGEDKIVMGVSGEVYLIGRKSNNYHLTSFLSSASIHQKPIEVRFKALDKYFDGTDIADVSDISFNGIFINDISDVFVDISMALFEDAFIGKNKKVFVDSLDISGSKSKNYEMNTIQNQTAAILRPVEFIEPKISYEEIYLGIDYSRKFVAIGNTPFVYNVSDGRLPNGLSLIGNEISGNVIETGIFNFIVSASIPNIYIDKKLYTLRVKPLVSIKNQKIFPISTIGLASGSSFDFLDPQIKNYIQQASLVYSDEMIIFGNSIFDTGIQISIDKATHYRYVFAVIDNPKSIFENVDYMFIFKVFDENGNLISNPPTPIPLSIYLDNAQRKHIDLFVASNPQIPAGKGDYVQRVGSKYKYSCNITRGDGAILVYLSNSSSDELDGQLISIFDHLDQVNRFLISDYMTTPQLYIDNNLNDKFDEWKTFIETKFPTRDGNKKLSEL